MNARAVLIVAAISAAFVGMAAIPVLSDQFADAGSTRKVHFTQTIASSQDPGQGYGDQQLVVVLSPNAGTIYDGSLTYAASDAVQIVVLHEIAARQSQGQPTWSVDGETHYAMSLIEPGTGSGSFEFTGAALALRAGEGFTATVSVDGWIRGQPTEVILQTLEINEDAAPLKLFRSSVPATIPLNTGLYNGEELAYIVTDASTQEHAELITEKLGRTVGLSELLSNVTGSPASVYMFTDGIADDGIRGYQHEVFSDTPAQDRYTALRSVIDVEWKAGQNPEILDSEEKILEAKKAGRITLEETDVILNMPQIKWPEGQMSVRDNSTAIDETPYETAQIMEINEEEMTVTFIAHRGWGSDGGTIYHIIADATPAGPAEMMGVTDAPTLADIAGDSSADVFHFGDGIAGPGPLGFQPVIVSVGSEGENYSPIWRVSVVEWNDPEQASLLTTTADIDALDSEELITISEARPLNNIHLINSPIVDPFEMPAEELKE